MHWDRHDHKTGYNIALMILWEKMSRANMQIHTRTRLPPSQTLHCSCIPPNPVYLVLSLLSYTNLKHCVRRHTLDHTASHTGLLEMERWFSVILILKVYSSIISLNNREALTLTHSSTFLKRLWVNTVIMVSVEEAQSHLTEKECYWNELVYILKYKDLNLAWKHVCTFLVKPFSVMLTGDWSGSWKIMKSCLEERIITPSEITGNKLVI